MFCDTQKGLYCWIDVVLRVTELQRVFLGVLGKKGVVLFLFEWLYF